MPPIPAMCYIIPLVLLIALAALVMLNAWVTRNHNDPEQ